MGEGGNEKFTKSDPKEKDPKAEVKNDVVRKLKSQTDAVARDELCRSAKRNKDVFLDAACKAGIEDINDQIGLVEALRSSKEFGILAEKLAGMRDFPDRKFKMLYPGSGAHLAPLILVSKLIDMNKIDEADVVYTEIAKVDDLKRNLNWFVSASADYKIDGEVVEKQHGKDGREYIFPLRYKGKLINLRYLRQCSDEEWFRREDFENTDVYVSHDGVGPDVEGPLYMVYKVPKQRETMSLLGHFPRPLRSGVETLGRYFPTMRAITDVAGVIRIDELPLIAMEDVTRSIDVSSDRRQDYHRQFDLELLGNFERGGKSGYGHRAVVYGKPLKECYGEGYDKMCDAIPGELGRADAESGVLLKMYPELMKLSDSEFQILMEVSVMGNNPKEKWGDYENINFMVRKRIPEYYASDYSVENLYGNKHVCDDFVLHGENVLKVLEKIDPRLSRGFALRMIQVFIDERVGVYHYLLSLHDVKDKGNELSKYLDFFRQIRKYLTDKEELKFGKYLDLSEEVYKKVVDDIDDSYAVSRQEFNAYLDRDDKKRNKLEKELSRKKNNTIYYRERDIDGGSKKIKNYVDNLFESISRGK